MEKVHKGAKRDENDERKSLLSSVSYSVDDEGLEDEVKAANGGIKEKYGTQATNGERKKEKHKHANASLVSCISIYCCKNEVCLEKFENFSNFVSQIIAD